jgi:hypothetical protein
MDKKIRNRILYVVVAILWGVAIYRTWKNYEVKEELQAENVINTPAISPMQFRKDTFELVLPDTDPFLQKAWIPQVQQDVSREQPTAPRIEKKEPVIPVQKKWPQVEYFGFVKNRNQNSTLCLLKIDGRQIQLSKGERHDGVLVQNAFKDSVQLIFEGEIKTVRK